MAAKYISTQYPGVRYRQHQERKFNGKPDRYFFIRYKRLGKLTEEGVGWSSNGMNALKANKLRAEIVQNIKEGKRPQSLKEKRELEEALIIAEREAEREKEAEQYSFGELAEKYIAWAKGSKKSWKDDKRRYEIHLKPVLADLPLKDISAFQIERIKNDLLRKTAKTQGKDENPRTLSNATVKHCLVLVRQMFNKAIAWGLFNGQNPIKQVKLPTVSNRRLRFLSHEEAQALLSELVKASPQVHDQAVLSLHCGLRFGEIANLTLADLNFTNDIIQIRDPKGESRQAYMTSEVKAILLSRKPSQPNDLVFPDVNGNRQKSISKTFDRTIAKLGLNTGISDRRDKVVFHSLRHTFGSWLAIQGTPILTIKELMGHKTIEMTMRYAHLIPDVKQKAVETMARRFAQSQNGIAGTQLKIKTTGNE